MKKLFLWVAAGIFVLSTTAFAKYASIDDEKNDKQEKHKLSKEEKEHKKELAKKEKELKKAEAKSKKETEKIAKARKDKAKKHDKKITKKQPKKVKKTKPAKVKKEKTKKPAKKVAKKEHKKVKKAKPAKIKKENKKALKHDDKNEKAAEKQAKKDAEKAKKEREKELKKIDNQKRAEEKKAKKELNKKLQQDQKEQKKLDGKLKKENKIENKNAKVAVEKQKKNEKKAEEKGWWMQRKEERREMFHNRKEMMEKAHIARVRQVEEEKKAGKFAYLYKEPAWPTRAQFYENKDLFNVTLSTRYASDAFVGTDLTTSHDITKLAFGEKPIKVSDILLASKLVAAGKLAHDETIMLNAADPAEQYLKYMANEVLNFNGWTHQHQMSFGLSRYIWSNNLAVGVELPLVYKKNHLELNMQLSKDATAPGATTFAHGEYRDGVYGAVVVKTMPTNDSVEAAPNAFLRRYGDDPVRFVQDILVAKGMTDMGGSAMGLGDVECFINGRIKSILFDNMVLGLKFVFPTAKKATQSKLWAPDLGNGGFFEFGGFMSVMTSYKSYVNPHLMLEVSGSLPGNVDRRVPQKITQAATTDQQKLNSVLAKILGPDQQIAFGNRVKLLQGVGFSEFDTTVKGFADNVFRVKITKGAEIKMRIGNIVERFISRAGFLDIFYDLRGKFKDQVKGLTTDTFNTDILKDDSQEIEHRAGFDYSYQFDLDTRLRLGMNYVFAGKNVAKTIEGSASLSHSF